MSKSGSDDPKRTTDIKADLYLRAVLVRFDVSDPFENRSGSSFAKMPIVDSHWRP
jgi:hypothetical protein